MSVSRRSLNLEGDGQGIGRHGVSSEPSSCIRSNRIRHWQEQLRRTDFVQGQFGENFTLKDCPTMRCARRPYQIGTALFESLNLVLPAIRSVFA